VFGLGIALLLLTAGVWKAGWVKFTFFPKLESDTLIASLTMPVGTPLERTLEVVNRMERSAREALAEAEEGRPEGAPPLFEYSAAQVGRHLAGGGPHGGSADTGGHLAQVYVQLVDGEKRDMRASELARLWREKLGPVPDAESITFDSALFRAGNPVEVHLSLDDHEKLLASAEALKAELRRYPGVFDVADSFLPGKLEMQLTLKRAARSLGLTLEDLASQVRHAFYGAEALRFQRDHDEVKVLVRYPEEERRSLGTVEEMRIRTPEGAEVPFEQVAERRMERGYSTIERSQRRRVIKVTADVDESKTNANEVRQDLMARVIPELEGQYPGLRTSMEGEGKEQQESLSDVFQGLAIALFGIYALLAIPFRSFSQPFVVMAAIPFGMVGAVLGHLIMGVNLSLLSLFGMVGLTGVVVNDSLVLIHATNRLREGGMGAGEAIVLGGRMRFRAILLTSLTTFAGLTPMILEKSLQARFLIPMAVSLGFGVLFATAITLLLVPCGYMILEDIRRALGPGRQPALSAEEG
jgi:multidrug efflux pump subunit AcrB